MSSSKPTIVFVTGAWHKPALYSPLLDSLEKYEYTVIAPHLPSVGGSQDNIDEDVTLIRQVIEGEVNRGQEVVVLMHSYGGAVGSAAVKGLSKNDSKTGGGVVKMIYMAAFALDEGISLMDTLNHKLLPWFHFANQKQYGTTDNINVFYNDVDPSTASQLPDRLVLHASGTFDSKQTYAAWRHIDSTYIICEQDMALPGAVQERLASQPDGRFTKEYLKAGHSPFLSMPQQTLEVIRKAIGDTV